MNDKELIADARAAMDYSDDTGWFWVGRLADALEARAAVPDAATEADDRVERIARGLAQTSIVTGQDARVIVLAAQKLAEVERDAALAAVERAKETLSLHNPNGRLVKEVLAALDGAPEPEGRWEYRGRLQSCGYVAEGYISAEHAMNGLKVELEDHPYLVMDDTAIVERARVREWLPVEGENW